VPPPLLHAAIAKAKHKAPPRKTCFMTIRTHFTVPDCEQ
jgi:hypothetical protein